MRCKPEVSSGMMMSGQEEGALDLRAHWVKGDWIPPPAQYESKVRGYCHLRMAGPRRRCFLTRQSRCLDDLGCNSPHNVGQAGTKPI